MPEPPRHLLTVWNPSYALDAMDEHLRLLIDWAERWHRGDAEEDDVYVWWAKLRSPSRTEPLPHHHDILRLQEQIDAGIETHLYLTDYRSLYVGSIDEITTDEVTDEFGGEWAHVPEYYRGKVAELWFCLTDIRRLVSDDTPAVIEELRRLRNIRYHGHPVSLYGGMYELPLIVTGDARAGWFEEADRADDRLWAERDAELRGTVERLARELRENLFGHGVWRVLEPATRHFVASGEAIYRTRRDDPHFDFSAAVMQYAKAVETELNAILFAAAERGVEGMFAGERTARTENRTLDLRGPVPHQPLGTLLTLLEHDEVFQKAMRRGLPQADWQWVLRLLPAEIRPIVDARNPAAHSDTFTRERVLPVRERVLGIGCEGLLVQLARVKLRAE